MPLVLIAKVWVSFSAQFVLGSNCLEFHQLFFSFLIIVTASTTSSSSQDSEPQFLHAGVCLRSPQISSKDALISREALELMVACLQLRPHNLGNLIGDVHAVIQ